jgi:hypothetical protein
VAISFSLSFFLPAGATTTTTPWTLFVTPNSPPTPPRPRIATARPRAAWRGEARRACCPVVTHTCAARRKEEQAPYHVPERLAEAAQTTTRDEKKKKTSPLPKLGDGQHPTIATNEAGGRAAEIDEDGQTRRRDDDDDDGDDNDNDDTADE